jgi:NAD(P)-dependent dehydrogenase (short-subunit alcohol dehydrogenase family)
VNPEVMRAYPLGTVSSKAALNQMVRTASIELKRRRPAAICIALHPGTVRTPLSLPFSKDGLEVQTPQTSAARLLSVIDALIADQSGGFFDHLGIAIPW